MPKNFYLADWHYDHYNILMHDDRRFMTLEEHNETLVKNWQKVVSPEDTVYVLGDMFWCKPADAIPVLEQLPGKKVLLIGNHDDKCLKNAAFRRQFEAVEQRLEVLDGQTHVVLDHYPSLCFHNRQMHNWAHLYGHVHNSDEFRIIEATRYYMINNTGRDCPMFNVGVMMPYMGYTPRTLAQIRCGYVDWINESPDYMENLKKSSARMFRTD
jgi:calcineurin-like phosphoesterase family protein